MKYTKEILEEAVARSTSIAGVLRHLGLKQAGGTQANIRGRIELYGLDTSHFRGTAHRKGRAALNRLHWSQVLTIAETGTRRKETKILRRALIEFGRPYECEGCGTGPEWLGSPLVLHVDHIEGNPYDSRPENLRFLCPNCHSQTPTWCGRHRDGAPTTPAGPCLATSGMPSEARE
ncbi:HNH endonuclease [Rhodococcus sp. Z13]|uniref:HNH endonuclease n=1 Tax=Rhodococcus sacchari TaxID=2962047 RepID=A0ACD4DK18_9NOCA|nr:HNH endonuclease [Rhodococcus sp. Z13]